MRLNDLFDQAVKGDKPAEKELFEFLRVRFEFFVRHKVMNEEDADEIVQNSLMVIFEKYKSVEIEKSLTGWAQGVLGKEILKYYTRQSKRRSVFESQPNALEQPDAQSGDPVLRIRLHKCLEELATINFRYARILQLKYQGFRTEEICSKLNIKSNNLYVILLRARSMLRQCLEEGSIRQ